MKNALGARGFELRERSVAPRRAPGDGAVRPRGAHVEIAVAEQRDARAGRERLPRERVRELVGVDAETRRLALERPLVERS